MLILDGYSFAITVFIAVLAVTRFTAFRDAGWVFTTAWSIAIAVIVAIALTESPEHIVQLRLRW